MSEDINLYKVVSSRGGTDGMYRDFYDEISVLMRQGWRCQGGVSVTRFSYILHEKNLVEMVYAQAMIRDDGKEVKA